ncbi:MAG: SUF system NifU family Fe-S cluster assembly protein [Thermoleophilia bacterium]|nr:SUF system NifU family Fe-S cluster assembly protein [Thermoleophilia bacterium]
MDDLYRENLMDHYQHPRNHGPLAECDAEAEGQNPLCGDQVVVQVKLADGAIEEMRFTGHGCAVSQAATSMLTELVQGLTVAEAAALPSQAILDELAIPLSAMRVKCAVLGLGTLKVALHRAAGTPLPAEWGDTDEMIWS